MSDPTAVRLDQARAHVLRKQGLAGAGRSGVADVVTATAGIYGTAPTCYLSCAARLGDFRLGHLDEELYVKRGLVRLRCMRGGMSYIEPLDLLPALFACTGEAPEKTVKRTAKWTGLTEAEILAFADRIEAAMAGRPPVTVRQIRELLAADLPGDGSALQMTVALLGRTGRIVRSEVRGSWRSDNYAYALWTDWLGTPLDPIEPAAARVELARRYLRAFGPATANDLKWWTGWTKRDTATALADLGDEIVAVSLEGADAWATADELDRLTGTDADEGRGVRLLPVWDAYFMGYATSPAGRVRQVDEADYTRVYDKSGNGTSTVIVDGMAAGIWELDHDKGTVTVAPFGASLTERWGDLETQVARLGEAIGTDLRAVRTATPGPLGDGPRNTYLAPISLRADRP
ncbi:winged helix DNA-binding domain-containing protein [Actinomadura sp. HBU206391]|uniref:winged helix DNA-binding domain-containing protein n=1 Tax=Actinomadura sp. HBU206391 TaxID=2731692 RepID=UPI0016501DCF|nr:winged helix DNA-binding domain-containing protein [Actinomadura sp. HBU206391]MBC6462693.1 winged helix DNA-binding domain-containing protein [Actinomadura sp. HBU206391]